MESCDLLIVGGGPAGSSLAWKLSNQGLNVLVVDKSTFPRDKVCAGWITSATVELLQLDREDYSRGRVFQTISGFRTSMMGGAEVITRYGSTVSYGIRRSEFDHYLLRRSGARLRLGESIRSMERRNGEWLINGDVRTPLVIGAGGHFCPVSRLLRGNRSRTEPAVIAQEVEFELDESQQGECRVAGDTPELYFCEDLKGYGWCVRKGNFLNIGLGREDSRNATEQVRSFVRYLRERKRIPANTPANFTGHAYVLYKGASQSLVEDGAMLIGDAAGLACPKSGEGIRPAVESALLAANVIVSAAGEYRRERLLAYPSLLTGRFGKGRPAVDLLPPSVRRAVSRRLMESRWFSRHVVLDRWFLNSSRPPLKAGLP
jgi:geranylgeranyl reductase family protein